MVVYEQNRSVAEDVEFVWCNSQFFQTTKHECRNETEVADHHDVISDPMIECLKVIPLAYTCK